MDKKKLLLLLDGSHFSEQIMPHVRRFVQPEEAEVVLLRVAAWPKGHIDRPSRLNSVNLFLPLDLAMYEYNTLHDSGSHGHPVYASQEAERVQALIVDELEEQAKQLQDAGYQTRVAVAFGDPAEEIIRFVEAEGIDLVAMATHGRSGLGQFVLGSVTEQVVRGVAVPVLTVRPTATAEKPAVKVGARHSVFSIFS